MSEHNSFDKGRVSFALESGLSIRKASEATGVSCTTVYRWKCNDFPLVRQQGSGRPSKTTERADRHTIRLAAADPTLSLSELAAESGIMSRCTVWRRLQSAGFVSRKKPTVIQLSAVHKQKRLEWAMSHCLWRIPQWKRVVWSDEASVRLRSHDGRLRLWIRPNHPLPEIYQTPMVQAGGGYLLIWGAIWIGGRSGLHIMRRTMNSERYVQVLESHVYPLAFRLGDPSTDWLYMDDNATPHRSHVTRAYKALAGIRTIPWPARSPDLNPIENVWSLLKLQVRKKLHHSDGLSELEHLLSQCWQSISQDVMDHLIESMPSRTAAVIKHHGGSTEY